jgi:hypothetical protein
MLEVGFTLMAHAMHQAGAFPSVKEARKNGWNKPLAVGSYTVGKKKRVIIEP